MWRFLSSRLIRLTHAQIVVRVFSSCVYVVMWIPLPGQGFFICGRLHFWSPSVPESFQNCSSILASPEEMCGSFYELFNRKRVTWLDVSHYFSHFDSKGGLFQGSHMTMSFCSDFSHAHICDSILYVVLITRSISISVEYNIQVAFPVFSMRFCRLQFVEHVSSCVPSPYHIFFIKHVFSGLFMNMQKATFFAT